MAPPKPPETLFEGERLSEARLQALFPAPGVVERLLRLGVMRPAGDGTLQVRFVGVAATGGRTFQMVPKVLPPSTPPAPAMLQVVRALQRYHHWKPSHHEDSPLLRADPDRPELSAIAVADWLIRDYRANGLYRRMRQREEVNGPGEHSWQRTLERFDPIVTRRGPIYAEVVTRARTRDSDHFISRLHRHSIEAAAAQHGPLLGHRPVTLDQEPFEPFGQLPPLTICRSRIAQELRESYSDRALQLLPMIRAWLIAEQAPVKTSLALYGTSFFHNVWEAACALVLGNEVERWLPSIPVPEWTGSTGIMQPADGTFRPDVVTSLGSVAGGPRLLIADAKYYALGMPPGLRHHPGVNDVAKQIWYEQCLRAPAAAAGYAAIDNIFVVPGPDGGASFQADGHVDLGGEAGGRVGVTRLAFVETLKRYAEASRPLPQEEIASVAAGAGSVPAAASGPSTEPCGASPATQ